MPTMRTAPCLFRSQHVECNSTAVPCLSPRWLIGTTLPIFHSARNEGVTRFFAPVPGTLFADVASNGSTDSPPRQWPTSIEVGNRKAWSLCEQDRALLLGERRGFPHSTGWWNLPS